MNEYSSVLQLKVCVFLYHLSIYITPEPTLCPHPGSGLFFILDSQTQEHTFTHAAQPVGYTDSLEIHARVRKLRLGFFVVTAFALRLHNVTISCHNSLTS